MEDPLQLAICEAKKECNTNLFLNYMNLVQLPDEVLELQYLKNLYLKRNLLQSLPAKLCQLKGLVQLYLDSNSLSSLPESIGELTNLRSLVLNRNHLVVLPGTIGGLKELESLQMSHNHLEELPSSICQLQKLHTLNVMNNELHWLPPEIGCCSSLKMLQVDGNFIRTFPNELLDLEKLQELSASGNQLIRLPHDINELKQIELLYIDANLELLLLPGKLLKMTKLELLGTNRCSGLYQDTAFTNLEKITGMDWLRSSSCQLVIPLKELAFRASGHFLGKVKSRNAIHELPSSLCQILKSPGASCFVCSTVIYRAAFYTVDTLQRQLEGLDSRPVWYKNDLAHVRFLALFCSVTCARSYGRVT